ncbi:hypothetical protein swp_1884 [Shewanella piezotolerans WP3]|uniref:Uncharacterized protein n=1 Tax=Shewanella piezotolerans (strain WP3 / JCM 13877) TaxID=225849 RepID=B8CLJ3_SHEPW|nr:hypothetical protein swp_1884 [Shewanella piezotolerans WP3]
MIYSECFLANEFKADNGHNGCSLLPLSNAEVGSPKHSLQASFSDFDTALMSLSVE